MLTALHLVDRKTLTTAGTVSWELQKRTDDTIRGEECLVRSGEVWAGRDRSWICDVMRPIRQLVYLAGVGGGPDGSYAVPPAHRIHHLPSSHTHTYTHLLCSRQDTSFPSLSPAWTRSMKNGCSADTQKWLLKTRGEGKRVRRRRQGRWNWKKLSPD